MIRIENETDIRDALAAINDYLEDRGSELYVTIVPRAFAEAVLDWYKEQAKQTV